MSKKSTGKTPKTSLPTVAGMGRVIASNQAQVVKAAKVAQKVMNQQGLGGRFTAVYPGQKLTPPKFKKRNTTSVSKE